MCLQSCAFRTVFALLLACVAWAAPPNAPQQSGSAAAGVACRALEVHTDAANRTTIVVFHQATESNRAPLVEFLHAHSGAVVEVENDAGGGALHGTAFRLKSCFGRGLLLLPAAVSWKEGTVFHMRLSELRAAASGPDHE